MGRLTHKHHIIPRHKGGTDNPENLVELTVTQHAMWHFAEWQRCGDWQDEVAWKALAKHIGKAEVFLRTSSEGGKAFSGPCPARKGAWARLREDPEAYAAMCQKMSEGWRKKLGPKKEVKPKDPEETRRKISESLKGRQHTDEAKKRMSEAAKRRWERARQGKK